MLKEKEVLDAERKLLCAFWMDSPRIVEDAAVSYTHLTLPTKA